MTKIQQHITDNPLARHHPQSWREAMDLDKAVILDFRNRNHFINTMSSVTALDDSRCGISYANALTELKAGTGVIPQAQYDVIKHKVKESLLKKNLISESIYEGFEYTHEGELVDIARFMEGNPQCCITPKSTGKNYFYELYINISVNGNVSNKTINDRVAQILATVELLESERIYIKLNVIDTSINAGNSGKPHCLVIVPIFSHRDHKNIDIMSSIVNERFLRKFMFTLSESIWEDDLDDGYGKALSLPNTINIADSFDCTETASHIIDQLVTPCKNSK